MGEQNLPFGVRKKEDKKKGRRNETKKEEGGIGKQGRCCTRLDLVGRRIIPKTIEKYSDDGFMDSVVSLEPRLIRCSCNVCYATSCK